MRSVSVIATVLGLVGFGLAAPSDQDQLRAAYKTLRKAMMSKDLATIDSLGAPGMQSKHGQTVLNAEQSNQMMKQTFAAVKKFTQLDIVIKSIQIHGKTAVVTTFTTMKGDLSLGPNDKTVHKLAGSGGSRDAWVKTAKGWKVKLVEDLPGEKSTIDGKPAPVGM